MSLDLWAARMKEINDAIESGEIETASRDQLAKFNTWLCHPNAGMCFAKNYSQICETVRFHLLKSFIDGLDRKNVLVQKLVIVLTAAALIVAVPQIWFAYKADKRAEIAEETSSKERTGQQSQVSVPIPAQPQTNHQAASSVTAGKTTPRKP